MSIKSLVAAMQELPKDRINYYNTDPKDANALRTIRQQSENVHIAVNEGIKGLGVVLANAAANKDAGLNPENVSQIGWLLGELADLADVAYENSSVGTGEGLME